MEINNKLTVADVTVNGETHAMKAYECMPRLFVDEGLTFLDAIECLDPFYAQRYHSTPLNRVESTIATRRTVVAVNRFMRASSARFCGTE